MKLAWAALLAAMTLAAGPALADANKQTKGKFDDKFRQLEVDLPTPNTYRTASGAPGEAYWQQQADYQIKATLDEARKRITATGTITYRNNSPHALNYVWLQLDQNIFKQDSASRRMARQPTPGVAGDGLSIGQLRQMQSYVDTPHGFEIQSVGVGEVGAAAVAGPGLAGGDALVEQPHQGGALAVVAVGRDEQAGGLFEGEEVGVLGEDGDFPEALAGSCGQLDGGMGFQGVLAPRWRARKASWSLRSSMILAVGLPAP